MYWGFFFIRGNITASAAIKQNDREKKRGPAAGTKRFKSARAFTLAGT